MKSSISKFRTRMNLERLEGREVPAAFGTSSMPAWQQSYNYSAPQANYQNYQAYQNFSSAQGGARGVTSSQLQQAQQLLMAAQQNEKYAAQIGGTQGQRYAEAARLQRLQAAQLLSNAGQTQKSTPQPQAQQQQQNSLQQVQAAVKQNNQAWLNAASRAQPGRNGGFLIYYSRGPIYQGDTRFTQVPRPYFVKAHELYRVISQMTNNLNRIDSISRY